MNNSTCLERTRQGVGVLLASLGVALALPVYAVPVTVAYSGVVSRLMYANCVSFNAGSCSAWDFTSPLSSDFADGRNVEVGNTFAGGFAYESAAPLTAMSSDGFQAVHLNSVHDAHFQSNELALPTAALPSAGLGSFSVVNNRPIASSVFDSFYVNSVFSGGGWFASVEFHLQDSTGAAWSSFDVPLSLDFSSFNGNVFYVAFLRRSDGDQLHVHGDLTSVAFSSPVGVPEPASITLLLIGLLAAASMVPLFRRRRSIHSVQGSIAHPVG